MKSPLKSHRKCDLPRELVCRNCGASYIGMRGGSYCPTCRPIMTKKHRAEKIQIRKDGTFTDPPLSGEIPAICPYCRRVHNVSEKEKMSGGRIPRICCGNSECVHKKMHYNDIEDHHVYW